MKNPLSVNSRVSMKSNYENEFILRFGWAATLYSTLWSGTISRFQAGPEHIVWEWYSRSRNDQDSERVVEYGEQRSLVHACDTVAYRAELSTLKRVDEKRESRLIAELVNAEQAVGSVVREGERGRRTKSVSRR